MVQVLQSLRTSVTSSGNPLSEAEMDRHTLKGLREGGPMQQPLLIHHRMGDIWAAVVVEAECASPSAERVA